MVPSLVGDPWQVCGVPDLGVYNDPDQQPVDFGLWQSDDGTWQLWSCIRNTACGGNSRLFYAWEGAEITDTMWTPKGISMMADASLGETLGGLQAPHVIRDDDGIYKMVYGDWVNICLATGTDGKTFDRVIQNSGNTGMFSESDRTWDPMLLKVDDTYYCYYTALPGTNGLPSTEGATYCRTSTDLTNWSDSTVVNRGGVAGTGSFSSQCPFVWHDTESDLFYLFRTNRTGSSPETTVYCSPDPLNFGLGTDEYRIGTLPIAAPEVVKIDGEFYVGWMRTSYDGLQISRLTWSEAAQEPTQKFDRSPSYSQAVQASSPLAYWRLEDAQNTPGSVAADMTGNHNGTYCQTLAFAEGAPIGETGQAIQFGEGWIDLGTLPGFGETMAGGVTVEMWVKSSQTSEGMVFGLGGSTPDQFFINLDENPNGTAQDDRIRVFGRSDNLATYGGADVDTNITDGQWHYLAITYVGYANEAEIRIYMADADEEQTRLVGNAVLSSGMVDSDDFLISAVLGGLNSDTGPRQFFNGLLDEVALYDRVLSQAELDAHLASIGGLAGDANGDGRVDGSDVTILAGNWQVESEATWSMGDFNGDGRVDGSDVTILAGNWQASVSSQSQTVPEPSSWMMLLILISLISKAWRTSLGR